MKQQVSIIIALAATAATLFSCSGKKDTETSEVMPIDVAMPVTDSVVLYRTYPGTLTPDQTVTIVARVSGNLTSVNYTGGDIVKKGMLLFTIEDTKYRDAVQQAQSQLNSAISSRDYAASHYAAMQKALKSDAVSQMEVKEAKSALEQAEASIRSARAALQTAQTNLSYCRVYSPMTGRITSNNLSVGSYLNGEGSPVTLATIYDDSKLNANFSIEDASFLRSFVNTNGRDKINYDSIPINFTEQLPHSYTGKLHYITPEVDTSTGTMTVQATVQNPYQELRGGMYATVSLPYKLDPKAILIKDSAISTDQLGKYVYVVNDSNKVVYTPITVGQLVNDSMRVVTKGLDGKLPYVTKALLKVRTGMEVKPVMQK